MNTQIRKIAFAAAVAALYVALTLAVAPVGFGLFQFRISEALTILPFFFPVAVPGLFAGCLIANLLSPFGFADVIVGSSATLLAALLTMMMGKSRENNSLHIKALACFPPVLINAVFIGALITFFSTPSSPVFWKMFPVNALYIGLEQTVVLYALGFPLMIILPKMGVIDRLRRIYQPG